VPITFHPRAGCVLICHFDGYVAPEIVKARPVVIVSPHHLNRGPLYCVVPLSTTAPHHVEPYHYQLKKNPIPSGDAAVWAKCDMVSTARVERLDRFKVGSGSLQDLRDHGRGARSNQGMHEIRPWNQVAFETILRLIPG